MSLKKIKFSMSLINNQVIHPTTFLSVNRMLNDGVKFTEAGFSLEYAAVAAETVDDSWFAAFSEDGKADLEKIDADVIVLCENGYEFTTEAVIAIANAVCESQDENYPIAFSPVADKKKLRSGIMQGGERFSFTSVSERRDVEWAELRMFAATPEVALTRIGSTTTTTGVVDSIVRRTNEPRIVCKEDLNTKLIQCSVSISEAPTMDLSKTFYELIDVNGRKKIIDISSTIIPLISKISGNKELESLLQKSMVQLNSELSKIGASLVIAPTSIEDETLVLESKTPDNVEVTDE